jgi:hypothetical protein
MTALYVTGAWSDSGGVLSPSDSAATTVVLNTGAAGNTIKVLGGGGPTAYRTSNGLGGGLQLVTGSATGTMSGSNLVLGPGLKVWSSGHAGTDCAGTYAPDGADSNGNNQYLNSSVGVALAWSQIAGCWQVQGNFNVFGQTLSTATSYSGGPAGTYYGANASASLTASGIGSQSAAITVNSDGSGTLGKAFSWDANGSIFGIQVFATGAAGPAGFQNSINFFNGAACLNLDGGTSNNISLRLCDTNIPANQGEIAWVSQKSGIPSQLILTSTTYTTILPNGSDTGGWRWNTGGDQSCDAGGHTLKNVVVQLVDYTTLPNPSPAGTLAYNTSTKVPVFSDGSFWYPITLGAHY